MGNHLFIYSTHLLSARLFTRLWRLSSEQNRYKPLPVWAVAQETWATFILLLWLSASRPFIDAETEVPSGEVTQPVRSRVELWLHLFIISKWALSTPLGRRERTHPRGNDFTLQKERHKLVDGSRIGIFYRKAAGIHCKVERDQKRVRFDLQIIVVLELEEGLWDQMNQADFLKGERLMAGS